MGAQLCINEAKLYDWSVHSRNGIHLSWPCSNIPLNSINIQSGHEYKIIVQSHANHWLHRNIKQINQVAAFILKTSDILVEYVR